MKSADDNSLWNLQYLKDSLGVTEEEIEEAVSKVGTNEDYIKMYLLNKQGGDDGDIKVPSANKNEKSDNADSDENISDVFDNTLGADTD